MSLLIVFLMETVHISKNADDIFFSLLQLFVADFLIAVPAAYAGQQIALKEITVFPRKGQAAELDERDFCAGDDADNAENG